MIELIYDFFICSMATLFFAILFRTPVKAIAASSIIGGLSYVVYDICCENISLMFGYFFGTLFISVCAEILARIRKMPALIYITPGVIPLVPGVGLYHTMRFFVNGDTAAGLAKCVETLACAGVMAFAIALPPMLLRVFVSTRKR
ncbi:MAG: threonine/serine exporter [Ruminococcaceae bacterium]|nr:threonine/serine exporter [Oscillospiraceae bacterium]